MLNFIIKLKLLFKMFNFTKNNHLVITYGGSKITMTPEGDIIINAKRNLIHNYRLLFQGCEPNYINTITKAEVEGRLKEVVEEEVDKEIIKEAQCQI